MAGQQKIYPAARGTAAAVRSCAAESRLCGARKILPRFHAIVLLALLLLFASAPLHAAVTQQKKTKQSAQSQSHKSSARSKSKKKAHGRWRKRVHWLPGPRFTPAKKAEMIRQISEELNDPGSSSLDYAEALANFYAALLDRSAASGDVSPASAAALSAAALAPASAGVSTPASAASPPPSATPAFPAATSAAAASPASPAVPAQSTLRVLQFGDSHTAADIFTGEARRIFQEKFGNGGIGFAYPGHPFAGYRVFGTSHSATDGWTTSGNHFLNLGDGRTGLGGLSISTSRANESVSIETPCASIALEYLVQPNGGSVQFTDNGTPIVQIETAGESFQPGFFSYQCPAGVHRFTLTTLSNQPVTLLGWVATQPGVTWECLGINGAEAPLILQWDQALFSAYLKSNDPALIVLAYGTNEAASSTWDQESYARRFAQIIETLHSYTPAASILVIGPPDRSTVVRRRWKTFTGTDKIIAAQKSVCARLNCAYWDQRERMGGTGAMQDWAGIGWAQADHTHFTSEGYRALADALMLDLMTGFDVYKQRAQATPSRPGSVKLQRSGNGTAPLPGGQPARSASLPDPASDGGNNK